MRDTYVNMEFGIFFHFAPQQDLRARSLSTTYLSSLCFPGAIRSMLQAVPITPDFSVTPALRAEDFHDVAAQGYRVVINFLPDGETARQISSDEARKHCEKAGMAYFHVPAPKYGLFAEDVIQAAHRALATQRFPVLAYCSSGRRAAIVWAAVRSQAMPVDTVLRTLKHAGFDFSFIREDLELQADRPRWQAAHGSTNASPQPLPAA